MPPDARDVVWRNVAQSREAREARSGLVDVYVYAVALLWSSFIVARPRLSSRKSAATPRRREDVLSDESRRRRDVETSLMHRGDVARRGTVRGDAAATRNKSAEARRGDAEMRRG